MIKTVKFNRFFSSKYSNSFYSRFSKLTIFVSCRAVLGAEVASFYQKPLLLERPR